jgi:hypothetical protein
MSADTILADYLSFIGQALVANKIQLRPIKQLMLNNRQFEYIQAIRVLKKGDVYTIIDGKFDPIPEYKPTSVSP